MRGELIMRFMRNEKINYLSSHNYSVEEKANIIKNVIAKKTYKGKILNVLDRLGYEQEKAAEKFYEMFDEENSKVY